MKKHKLLHKKIIIALFLIGTLCCSLLAGCSCVSNYESEAKELYQFLSGYTFRYLSDDGNKSEEFKINPDGSFEGVYQDVRLDESGEGYNSTIYKSVYAGHFIEYNRIDYHRAEITIKDLSYDVKPNTVVVENNIRYIYTKPAFLQKKEMIYGVYLPGTKKNKIRQDIVPILEPVITEMYPDVIDNVFIVEPEDGLVALGYSAQTTP